MNSQPRILVGCPTADVKDYCLEKYIKAVKSLTYPNYDVLIVDNSEDNNYLEKIKKHLPVIKAPHEENVKDRIINSRSCFNVKDLTFILFPPILTLLLFISVYHNLNYLLISNQEDL